MLFCSHYRLVEGELIKLMRSKDSSESKSFIDPLVSPIIRSRCSAKAECLRLLNGFIIEFNDPIKRLHLFDTILQMGFLPTIIVRSHILPLHLSIHPSTHC